MEDSVSSFYCEDSASPSFIELQYASDMLKDLPTVIDALIEKATQLCPSFSKQSKRVKIICLSAILLAEGISLYRCKATLGERFFGLKRSGKFALISGLLELSVSIAIVREISNVKIASFLKDNLSYVSVFSRLLFLLGVSGSFSIFHKAFGAEIIRGESPEKGSIFVKLLTFYQLVNWLQLNRSLFTQLKPFSPPNPPPPTSLIFNEHKGQRIRVPVDPVLCALCLKQRTNPTAVITGFVFCYKCILSHQNKFGNICPVTGLPIGNLRRLY